MSDEKRETFAVTPPGLDTPACRAWLQGEAEAKNWNGLEWADETDQHGNTMGRLTGWRPSR